MRIAVIQSSLNMLGGAEKLCIIAIKALQEAGHRVTLVSVDKTDWPLMQKRYNVNCSVNRELYLIPNILETSSMISRMIITLFALYANPALWRLKRDHDVVLNMSGDIICLAEDAAYVNALPLKAAFDYQEILPRRNFLWRFGSKAYGLFLGTQNKLNQGRFLLTNSSFNAVMIKKYFGRSAVVVYPPVDVVALKHASEDVKTENIVVSVSRFRLGKNLEWIPRIAKNVQNAKFLIVGSRDKASTTAIGEISSVSHGMCVENRVELVVDRPFSDILGTLRRAKILLQTQRTEAFGMAVVEAMAAGCVPLVPRDGGPWFDILERGEGKYGFSYRSLDEAAKKIRMLLENEDLRAEVSARAAKRAMAFDSSIFEKKILRIVEKVYSWKKP